MLSRAVTLALLTTIAIAQEGPKQNPQPQPPSIKVQVNEVIVPVTNGKLDFGPWQQVYYAEFDGQRPKRLIIKVMGE